MSDQEATDTIPSSSEPTIEEWHELLDVVMANISCEVERTVGYLMRTTPSGKAYLDKVKAAHPDLEIGNDLSLIEITDTYEATFVVDRLLANSRYGIQRDLYIHEFALTKGWVCEPQNMYLVVLDLLRVKEKRAKAKDERKRIQEVRAAVERELICEDVKAYLKEEERRKG